MKNGEASENFIRDSLLRDFQIDDKKLVFMGVQMDYQLKGKYLQTSPTSGFKIEKISQDSLVLCQHVDNFSSKKLECYYLVRSEKLWAINEANNSGKKILLANKDYSPKPPFDINLRIAKKFGSNHSENFYLAGYLKLYIGKNLEVEIISSTAEDMQKVNIVKEELESTYSLWDTEKFHQYEQVIIPFIFQIEKTTGNAMTFRGIAINYYTLDFSKFPPKFDGKCEQEAEKLFAKAVSAYEAQRYSEAAELFKRSYYQNPRNIDSRINQAAADFESGNKDDACKIWNEVKLLGKKSVNDYLKNCN